ncbi:MAG: hypothetical protein KC549_16500 [Myxococcales bacterium]|nr:hypothetical protein [Myxococcales bacterium]MCB9548674.1 hypothetical protein [Myxococcales bacterium]
MSRAADARPYITYNNLIIDVQQLWHATNWRWSGAAWKPVTIVSGLLDNPYATTAARPPAAGLSNLVHAWRRIDNTIRWRVADGATGALLGAEFSFSATYSGYPAGLAIQSNDAPVFTFERPLEGVSAARWDLVGGVLAAPKPLVDCALGGRAPLQLDTNDAMHAVCATPVPAPPAAQVNEIQIYQEVAGVMVASTVFDNKDWRLPDLAMVGDDAVVAAYNASDGKVEVRWQDGFNVFEPAVTLMQLPAGESLAALAVDARDSAEGRQVAVVARAGVDRIYYAERTASGSISPLRRADLFSENAALDCNGNDFLNNNVDVMLPNDDVAWLNWQIEQPPGNGNLSAVATRYTTFRRADVVDHDHSLDANVHPQETASLALGAEGDGWSCFYDEDPGGPDDALLVRLRDGAPIVALSGSGLPSTVYTRSCDVGVDGFGNLHVVAGDWTNDKLFYRRRSAAGVWAAVQQLNDTHGAVPADGQVALAVEQRGVAGGDRVAIAYRRPAWGGGVGKRLCVLEGVDGINWTTTCFPGLANSAYPDITTFGPEGEIYAVAYAAGTYLAPQIRLAISTGVGVWSDELIAGESGLDLAVSARAEISGTARIMVAWTRSAGGGVVRLAERIGVGAWAIETISNVYGRYLGLRIAPNLDSGGLVTWRHPVGTSTLRLSTTPPFAGGSVGATAESQRRNCDLRWSAQGTALELDVFGNPRIQHRHADGKPMLRFITRP